MRNGTPPERHRSTPPPESSREDDNRSFLSRNVELNGLFDQLRDGELIDLPDVKDLQVPHSLAPALTAAARKAYIVTI